MITVSITATARSYPRLPYEQIKTDILGSTYELSLAFVGETRARELNKRTRRKNYIPNVLSFPLDASHGEIVIAPIRAKREAKRFGLSSRGYIGFLFIHGLLHLKGHDHGRRMDTLEQKYLARYELT